MIVTELSELLTNTSPITKPGSKLTPAAVKPLTPVVLITASRRILTGFDGSVLFVVLFNVSEVVSPLHIDVVPLVILIVGFG